MLNCFFVVDDLVLEVDDGIYDMCVFIMVNDFFYGYVEIGLNIVFVIELVFCVKNWMFMLVFMEFIFVGLCLYILGLYLMF